MIYVIIIIASYFLIAKDYLKSRRAAAGDGNEGNNRKGDDSFFLSFKITILIGSQLLCWLPLNAAIIASLMGKTMPIIVSDAIVANVMPLSSMLNPILHSDLMKKMMSFLRNLGFVKRLKLKLKLLAGRLDRVDE